MWCSATMTSPTTVSLTALTHQEPKRKADRPSAKDPGHPVYNAIPGRYANRIGNGQYTIDGVTYKTEQNDGNNTLHSGTNNWSFRNFNVTAFSKDSITFSILDASNSSQGMLGRVESSVTYSVTKNTWKIKITANSLDQKTRQSLSSFHQTNH